MSPEVDRDRFVDLLRGASIVVVVLGHWLMAAVTRRDGVLRADNALAVITWLQPLTWLLQVVPVFFVAGGFAAARSLSRPGSSASAFMARRVTRVVPPAATMAAAVMLVLGLGPHWSWPAATVRDVGAVVAQPLWFLAVYLILALLAPLQLRLHRDHRWVVLLGVPVTSLGVDVLRLTGRWPEVAMANYALVFAFAQELGSGTQTGARSDGGPVVGRPWLQGRPGCSWRPPSKAPMPSA